LYISSKAAGGFDVRELGGGTSDVPFSYRILARRKDLAGKSKRLEKIELPRSLKRGGERGVTAGDDLPKSPQRSKEEPPRVPSADELSRVVPNFSARDEEPPSR
jgi:hypothetical protein